MQHREHARRQLKELRESSHEHKAEDDKAYYLNSREKILAKCKVYRDAHKEKARKYHKMYREQNVTHFRGHQRALYGEESREG